MTVEQLDNGARLVTFAPPTAGRCYAAGGNFTAEWIGSASGPSTVESGDEAILIAHRAGCRLGGAHGDMDCDAGTVAILPPGRHTLDVHPGGTALVLATDRPDLASEPPINAGDPRDPRIRPIRRKFTRKLPLRMAEARAVQDIPLPDGNPRLRFLQTATMSINLVLYDGARGRNALSPHKHADIEQGSLALEGNYVHHLRLPWGPDADKWVDDAHVSAGPGTLLLIPPELIHTTEGVEDGPHFLIDIFAPVRLDFRDKGWIANSRDYEWHDE